MKIEHVYHLVFKYEDLKWNTILKYGESPETTLELKRIDKILNKLYQWLLNGDYQTPKGIGDYVENLEQWSI